MTSTFGPTTTTIVAETTTTVDFARPIVEATDPLTIEADPPEIAALVDDLRGQTDNVARQMQRIGPFPWLAAPAAVQIIDIDVVLEPADEDRLHPAVVSVRYRVPDSGPVATRFLADSFRAQGWNQIEQTEQEVDGATVIEATFGKSGVLGEEVTSRIEIRPGVTIIALTHRLSAEEPDVTPSETGTYLERLSAWAGDLPVPRAADLVAAELTTADDRGRIAVRYRLAAGDEAAAVAAVVAQIGDDGYRLNGFADGEQPVAGPLTLVDEGGATVTVEFSNGDGEGTFELELATTFELTPID